MAEKTAPVPVWQDEPRREEAAYHLAASREVGAIAPALACGGSAATRLLQALLRGHPNLAVWG